MLFVRSSQLDSRRQNYKYQSCPKGHESVLSVIVATRRLAEVRTVVASIHLTNRLLQRFDGDAAASAPFVSRAGKRSAVGTHVHQFFLLLVLVAGGKEASWIMRTNHSSATPLRIQSMILIPTMEQHRFWFVRCRFLLLGSCDLLALFGAGRQI